MLHRQTVLGGDSRYITTPPLTLTLTNMRSFHVFDEKMKEVSRIIQKMMLVPMVEAIELVQSVRATTYAWEGVWENDDLSRDGVEVSLRKFLEKLGTGATSTFCAAYESPVRAELFNAIERIRNLIGSEVWLGEDLVPHLFESLDTRGGQLVDELQLVHQHLFSSFVLLLLTQHLCCVEHHVHLFVSTCESLSFFPTLDCLVGLPKKVVSISHFQ